MPATLRLAPIVLLLAACTTRIDPGPIHPCPVGDWEVYEGGGCSCDPQYDPPSGRPVERGTMVGLFAPPGSLAPGADVIVRHAGSTSRTIAGSDGSFGIYVSNTGYDLRGDIVEVESAGRTYRVLLDVLGDEAYLVATDDDERFPPGAIAIEEPTGTIAVRARVAGRGSPIEHFAISATLPVVGEWFERPPGSGDFVRWFGRGTEGTPVGYVALHRSGAASGCYAGSIGRCECSIARREAHQCRFDVVAPGVPDDAGPPDGGHDTARLDAGPLVDGGSPW